MEQLGHQVHSQYLESSHHQDLTTIGERLRDWFTKTDFERIDPYSNHTHGESAAMRTVGSNFIETVSKLAEGEPFYFQGSAADVRRGRQVSREWYWAKDLNMPRVCFPCASVSQQVCAMVDVDEYLNMPNLMATCFRPYLLYTFVPNRAGNTVGDRSYRFLADGSVEYVVSGGGVYHHYVWDYNHDSLKVHGSEWVWLGHGLVFPMRISYTAFYKVERRNVDSDHQVVLLSPMRRWASMIPFVASGVSSIQAPLLERFNPIDGEFVRVEVKTSDGLMISTARVGDFSCSLVPKSVDEEASIKASLTKDNLTVAMVKSSMDNGGVNDLFGAEVMASYHRKQNTGNTGRVFTTTDGVRAYQFLPKLTDLEPDAKPSMLSFMKPLVVGFCPADTKGNEKRGADERIKKVKSDAKLTSFLREAIDEFVDRLAPDILNGGRHLHEVDEDEVWDRQSRPTQRAILRRADLASQPGVSQVFVKRQAETKLQDPRIITQIDGSDKRDYSRFIYALAEALKRMPWYASGCKPRQISEKVAAIAKLVAWLLETDFSRMDGRISEVLRYLEDRLMHALFHPSVHARMEKLMKRQTFLFCSTKRGVHYNSGFARGSGSPETSAFNSIATLFCFYLALLLDNYSHDEAYKLLLVCAVCLGDDALVAFVSSASAEKAATMIGQKLTVSVRHAGDTVSFLARHYGPNVWYGSTDSCCDFKRQLSKFHLATYVENNSKARETKLREKSFAFFLTDENSPVVGDFVKKVLSLAPVQHGEGSGHEYKNILSIWNSDIPKVDQYPSYPDTEGWKLALLEKQLPDFSVPRFMTWLDTCVTMDDLMDAPEPLVLPAVHPGGKESVAVDGEVVTPPKKKSDSRRGTRGGKSRKILKGKERGDKSAPKDSRESGKPKNSKPRGSTPSCRGKKNPTN